MTLEQLRQMVEDAAYSNYLSHNCPAQVEAEKRADWREAEGRLLNELGRWPSHNQTVQRAQKLYEERCARMKFRDWIEAEQSILRSFGLR